MQRYHRIVWNEGLFLSPQHFQQWDLFHEAELVERTRLTTPYAWGIHALDLDREELSRGVVKILSARGLFPNGGSFRVPDIDPAPPSLPIKDRFDLRTESLDVFLAIPMRRSGWPNCLVPGGEAEEGETRYVARPVLVADENTGRNERSLQRAEQSLRLLLSTDNRDNYDCVPLARVARSSSGGYTLQDDFVPPLLSAQASPFLAAMMRSLLERLVARSSELGARFSEGGADARDITPANLRAFLQLSVINGAIPVFAHLKPLETIHPERVYTVLAELAGRLSTFNPAKVKPRDLPPYDHMNLGPAFVALERIIVDLLDLQHADAYVVIPLAPAGEGRFHAAFAKESLLEPNSTLILTASSEQMSEREILAVAPRVLISSIDRIQQKVNNRLPGLALHPLAVPPPAVPRRRGTTYFQLDARGPEWEAIRAAKNLAIDAPPEWRALALELLGVEGSR
ncbi:MAG: type VI secretion system baseplate subunit TssK [bacterium]